jgi:hypothetical protein
VRGDFDGVIFLVAADAVVHGVFNERLQDEAGDFAVEDGGVCGDVDAKAILETLALDAEVEIEEVELALEGDLLVAHFVERDPEEIAESEKNVFGGVGVFVNEDGGGLQGVKEEVRMELDAKHLELGGGDSGFEMGFVELAVTDLTLRVEVGGEQVENNADVEVEEEVLEEEGFNDELVERPRLKIFDVNSGNVETDVKPTARALQNCLCGEKDDGGHEVAADL